MEIIENMNFVISVLFALCYAYQLVYVIVPHIKKEKGGGDFKYHRYAVLICARNEQAVIGQLIDSIKAQDYPQELLDIFVAADNCTDSTAAVARRHGAQVWCRHSTAFVGKGYAMEFLLGKIDSHYPPGYYDGYFVFDADNILAENYISEMNRAFCGGSQVITSYRNSKNYGENPVSAGCGLWFLRESCYLHRSRALLGVSACVSGTGYLFSDSVYRKTGGWHFHLLTEDVEFSAYCITHGINIGYCHSAVFYDEQTASFTQSVKQRMRWAKGNFQVFRKYKTQLAKGAWQGSFSCLDMLLNLMPAVVLSLAGCAVNAVSLALSVTAGQGVAFATAEILSAAWAAYIMFFAMGRLTTITQWHSIYTDNFRKIAYMFTFPIFMMTYIPVSAAALFTDVKWHPIAHTKAGTLVQIKQGKL